MKENIEQILALLPDLKANLESYRDKNNKSAAKRARKISLELSKLTKEFRKASTNPDALVEE